MQANEAESPQSAYEMISSGNVELHNPIEYGILLLGNTKAGKTTSAQFLTNQILVGYKADQDRVFYKIQESQYKKAEIGEHERISKTQIPNLFQITMGGQNKKKDNLKEAANVKKSYLIDCPGYLDSFGCYRVFSNRFFHFLVFSKVEKIKFVITFTYTDIERTCLQMLKTFKQFLKGFKKINEVKDKIIGATSIMVTNVPPELTKEQVLKVFKNSAENIGSSLNQIFQALKNDIILNERIIIFHKAEVDKVCPKNKYLEELKKDDKKAGKFWVRSLEDNQQADMSNVQISLVDYSQEDPTLFYTQIKKLSQFYRAQILKQVENFIRIIKQFVQDNKVGGDSALFISEIMKMTAQKIDWRQNQKQKQKQLYNNFKDKRNAIKNLIFKPEGEEKSEKNGPGFSEIPFWLCKMKSFIKIQDFSGQISRHQGERDFQSLKMRQRIIKDILTIFINLGKKKKQKLPKIDQQKNEYILEFAYEVYKDINISNKLFNLVYEENADLNSEHVQNLQKNLSFLLVQYPAVIKKMFLDVLKSPSIQVFINNQDIIQSDQNMTSSGAAEIAKFSKLMHIKLEKYEKQNKEEERLDKLKQEELMKMQPSKQNQKSKMQPNINTEMHVAKKQKKNIPYDKIKEGLWKKYIQFSSLSFELLRKQVTPNLSKLRDMNQLRLETSHIIAKAKGRNDIEEILIFNNKIVQLMAEFLEKSGFYDLAIELYDSVFDVHKLIEIMDIKEEKIRKQGKKPSQMLDHLVKYMRIGIKYHLKDVALRKGYQARHYAIDITNTTEMSKINELLKQTCQNKKMENDQLYNHLFNQGGEASFDRKIQQEILKIADGSSKSQSPVKKSKIA